MNYIEKYLFNRALKKQVKKISSPDCTTGTLCQSYSWLMRLAVAHKDDAKALSDIFNALNICLENPKNDNKTYESALFSAEATLNKEPKLMIHSADFYKKISKSYGDTPLVPALTGFVENNPQAAPVITDCIKNIHSNNLATDGFSDRSVDLLKQMAESNHSHSPNLKILDGMLSIAKKGQNNQSEKTDNLLNSTLYNLDILIHNNRLSSPEEAKKAMEIIKIGLESKHENSFITATQALSRIIDKHPNMAKEVLNTLKSGLEQNMDSYRDSSSLIPNILQKIGNSDPSLAKEVTEIEKRLHPGCPCFEFRTNGKDTICRKFSYYENGALRGISDLNKDGKLHGNHVVMTKENTLLSEKSYKNGVKDGLSVLYGKNNSIMGIHVYDNGIITNTGIGTDEKMNRPPINKLSSGSYLQMFDNSCICFYPDGTCINVDSQKQSIGLSEKNGTVHQLTGQTASKIIQNMSSFGKIEDRVAALQTSCKNLLGSAANAQSKTH